MQLVNKIPADLIGEAAEHAARLIHDSIDQKFTPHFNGALDAHMTGKIGELLFLAELNRAGIHVKTTPIRTRYTRLSATDDFVIVVGGKDVQIEVKTASVFKPLDDLATGFRFMLNAAQAPYRWDFVVSIFVNLSDLTYRIMGCVERDHVDVYPIAGGRGVQHYEIPLEFLLPIECIWEDCSWKDQ